MVWTLITFGIAVFILWRFAFGPLQKIIDERRAAHPGEHGRGRGDARRGAASARRVQGRRSPRCAPRRRRSSSARAPPATTPRPRSLAEARAAGRARASPRRTSRSSATRAPRCATSRAQIAELTALATEKVTARSLTADDQQRLIDEALDELDVDELGDGGQGVSDGQRGRVYAQALFDAADDAGAVEPVGRELGDFVAALAASAPLRGVLADPQIDTAAKTRVVAELTRDAQPLVGNTLQLLLQRGRFGIVEELRAAYDALAAVEAAVVDVEVTSAVELTAATQRRSPRASRRSPDAGSSSRSVSTRPSSAASCCASAT